MDDVELRMNRLRTELYSEMRNQTDHVKQSLSNDIKDRASENKQDLTNVRDILSKDLRDVEGESKKELNSVKSSLTKEIRELKDVQNKYVMETDKTLLDHQKQLFQNKALVNDLMRRVYLLESIVTSKTFVQKEGYITFVSNDIVSISLGSANGVRAGDYFGVYKENEKIGVIKIETVEVDSSRGVIVKKVTAVSIGDRVDPEKTQ
jgi:exonuclease VII large subunit